MGLLQYIAGRFSVYIVVLFIGITIIFILPRLMPSDPIESYIARLQSQAGQTLSPEAVDDLRASLRQLYGLEGDLLTQYVNYVRKVFFSFDFGPSMTAFPRPVSEFIAQALPYTVGLLATTTIIAWLLGNFIGLVAGFFHNHQAATLLEVLGVVLYPIPYYILAVVLILLFTYIWPIFPSTTTFRGGPLTLEKLADIIRNSILPAMALILAGFGWNILGMKALAFSTKEEPYVAFARLKGVHPGTIMISYVFRNALLPQVTALALSLGTIFNGALLTEILFSYPGLGALLRSAVANGDYNMLYGTISVSIIAVATAALVIDLIYPLFDPRIRLR